MLLRGVTKILAGFFGRYRSIDTMRVAPEFDILVADLFISLSRHVTAVHLDVNCLRRFVF